MATLSTFENGHFVMSDGERIPLPPDTTCSGFEPFGNWPTPQYEVCKVYRDMPLPFMFTHRSERYHIARCLGLTDAPGVAELAAIW